MLNIAHRGASGAEPENTLSSFQKAIDLNVDMIEMDIRVCKSGEAIVIHDETVNRTTGGRGKVLNKDLDRIKMLDAGSGEEIPTLRESLELRGGKCLVNIELASENSALATAKVLESFYYMFDSIIISSFLFKELMHLHYLMPTLKLSYLTDEIRLHNVREMSRIPLYSINLNKDFTDKSTVQWLHALRFNVFVFTCNTKKEIDRAKDMGVEGIFTDFPELFHK